MTASTYLYGRKNMRRTPHQERADRINEMCSLQREQQSSSRVNAPASAPVQPPVQVVHTVQTVYVEPDVDELVAAVILGAILF